MNFSATKLEINVKMVGEQIEKWNLQWVVLEVRRNSKG